MKPTVVFLGSVPPPYMGPTLATEIILRSTLKDRFRLIHLDTSDHRDLSTLGAVDFGNIYLAIKHYCLLLWLILRWWPKIVYIPISQTTIGYLRDSVFIILAAVFRRKIVCHLRGGNFRNWYGSVKPLMQWYVRLVHARVDAQIVLGEKLKPLFHGLVPDEKIFVVPNGRDFEYAPRRDWSEKADHKVRVLYLSNFVRTKGVLDVLRAVPLICQHGINVEFLLAGDWNDDGFKHEMEDEIQKSRDYPIRVVGKVSGAAKYALLQEADIFVFPTYYPPEGHPWAIIEAMAAGLPVISTDQGAITESVVDGKNGFIVEKRNAAGIAEKVLLLYHQEGLRKRMGIESRRLYEDHFTESKFVDRISRVFQTVLQGGR